ncbi:MAG: PH domain-containing protein, partial [Ardenticatenales bacterium]|nr:PH domain-containing protein [Ardenticatenales bacterium]
TTGEEEERINLLYPGEFFGDISLLNGEPRGVTVRATMPSEVLFIEAEDFFALLEAYPELESSLNSYGEEIAERTQQRFEGQGKEEVVLYYARRHPFALVKRLVRVVVFLVIWAIALIGAYFIFQTNPDAQRAVAFIGVASLLIPTVLVGWEIMDWYNDYYILTNQRVIHIEKVIGFMNERFEAPLAKIQNVNVAQATPLAEMLGYGKVVIATAAQGGSGTLVLDYMPDADVIAERIIHELNKEKGMMAQQEKDKRRKQLRAALGFDPSAEAAATKAETPPPAAPKQRWPAFGALLRRTIHYLTPLTREQKGSTIMWRRHWILLMLTSMPFYLMLLGAVAGTLAAQAYLSLEGAISTIVWGVGGLVALVSLSIIIWLYADWRNDVYILTSDAILDEEQNPLGFNKETRRAPLDTIQDIRYVQNNPLMVWLGVGNVLIQTAGQQGEFTFDWVEDPQEVQYDIFQYIQARQKQRQQSEAAAINQELVELLKIYEEERHHKDSAPPPPAPVEVPTESSDPDATKPSRSV